MFPDHENLGIDIIRYVLSWFDAEILKKMEILIMAEQDGHHRATNVNPTSL